MAQFSVPWCIAIPLKLPALSQANSLFEIHKQSLYLIKSIKRSFQKQAYMIAFVTAVLNVSIWLQLNQSLLLPCDGSAQKPSLLQGQHRADTSWDFPGLTTRHTVTALVVPCALSPAALFENLSTTLLPWLQHIKTTAKEREQCLLRQWQGDAYHVLLVLHIMPLLYYHI